MGANLQAPTSERYGTLNGSQHSLPACKAHLLLCSLLGDLGVHAEAQLAKFALRTRREQEVYEVDGGLLNMGWPRIQHLRGCCCVCMRVGVGVGVSASAFHRCALSPRRCWQA